MNKEYADTWEAIGWQFVSQIKHAPTLSQVSVFIEFGWPRMDIDSCIKPLLDTLQGIAYVNDKQVDEIQVKRSKTNDIKIEISVLP